MKSKYVYVAIAVILISLCIYYFDNIKIAIMKLTLSKQQKGYFKTLNPAAKDIFLVFINQVKAQTGYDLYLTSSYRDLDQQTALQATNELATTAGNSYHNYGGAIDLNVFKDDEWINSDSTKAEWEATGVPAIAAANGIRWGGLFTQTDVVHFDIGYFFTIAQLKGFYNAQIANNPDLEGYQINYA